jgi:outer membrane protein TolC
MFTRLPSLDALVDSALARRSDLRALEDVAAAQRARAAVVHGSRRPQVRVAGRLTGTHGGTIDYDDTFWSVDATMTLPLMDMGRRKNLSRRADLDARAAELNVRDLEGRIRAEVAAALARVTARRSDVDTQWAAMELAAEFRRLERLKYDAGRGDIDNLLRARSGWRVAEAAWIRACYDLFVALDNLQLTSEGEGR